MKMYERKLLGKTNFSLGKVTMIWGKWSKNATKDLKLNKYSIDDIPADIIK